MRTLHITHYPLSIGNYTVSDVRGFDDIETCVSKDLRPGFEGHNVVEISWETNSTHGMYMCVNLIMHTYLRVGNYNPLTKGKVHKRRCIVISAITSYKQPIGIKKC